MTVWYRTVKGTRQDTRHWAFKFTWWEGDRKGERLDSAMERTLRQEIESGATVGRLRQVLGDLLGVLDSNRVMLVAVDGMRQGALQGNGWEVKKIREGWKGRWIGVDVLPPGRYILLKRGNQARKYVFHPARGKIDAGMSVGRLGRYVKMKILEGAAKGGYLNSRLPREEWEVRLEMDGQRLRDDVQVQWAKMYEVVLPGNIERAFEREEEWLIGSTATCGTCLEEKTNDEFLLGKITSTCRHEEIDILDNTIEDRHRICRDCLQGWLRARSDRWGSSPPRCPIAGCNQVLSYTDARKHMTEDMFQRYDYLVLRTTLGQLDEFVWCLNPDCQSGQLHYPEAEWCPEFQCGGCQRRYCLTHRMPWHEGQTCEEFDRRTHGRRRDDSEAEGRSCPRCKKRIYKEIGCDHMTCEFSLFFLNTLSRYPSAAVY